MSIPNKVGLLELLNKLGNENMKFQMLHKSITVLQEQSTATEITFHADKDLITPAEIQAGKPRNIPILVWIDKEKFDAARKELGI